MISFSTHTRTSHTSTPHTTPPPPKKNLSQVWISPNHCKAIWRVLRTELPILRWLARIEIGFAVTRKDKQAVSKWKQFRDTLACVWPFIFYYAASIAAITFVIVYLALGRLDLRQGLGNAAAALWTVLTLLLIWPPISTLLPRVYTQTGWKVVWKLPNVAENTVGVAGTVGAALSRVPTVVMAAAASGTPPRMVPQQAFSAPPPSTDVESMPSTGMLMGWCVVGVLVAFCLCCVCVCVYGVCVIIHVYMHVLLNIPFLPLHMCHHMLSPFPQAIISQHQQSLSPQGPSNRGALASPPHSLLCAPAPHNSANRPPLDRGPLVWVWGPPRLDQWWFR